jgi:hypothetical protein
MSSAGAAPASHWFEERAIARQPARAVTLDLRAAPVRAARCAAAASLRKSRGKVSQPGSPLSPITSFAAVLAVKGSLTPEMPPLTAPGRRSPTIRYEKRWLLFGCCLRHSTRSRWSRPPIPELPRYTQGKSKPMQAAAQAAKEKMSTPVFSLAASAAAPGTTKSEGTNPIPQPDIQAETRIRGFNLAGTARIGTSSWLSSTSQWASAYSCDPTALASLVQRYYANNFVG